MQLKTLPSKCAAQTQPSKLISGFYIWQYITRLFMICSQKIISWFFSRTKKWPQKHVSENQYTIFTRVCVLSSTYKFPSSVWKQYNLYSWTQFLFCSFCSLRSCNLFVLLFTHRYIGLKIWKCWFRTHDI